MADVVLALDVPQDYARRREVRERLQHEHAAGCARLRASIAARVEREGVKKGRSHALLGMARKWLQYDAKPVEDPEAWQKWLGQSLVSLAEVLDKLRAHKDAMTAAGEEWPARVPSDGTEAEE